MKNLIVLLIALSLAAAFAVLPGPGSEPAAVEPLPVQTVMEAIILDDLPAHRIVFFGLDGSSLYISNKILGVSKMSASRCYDEIEAFGIRQLEVKGRARTLTCGNKKDFWESIKSVLIDPVIMSYALRRDLEDSHALSGISALAGYSLLADDPYPTYGFTKKDIGSIDVSKSALIPPGETPGCIVQKIGYWIEFGDGTKMDPLSVALSISEEDKKDPRVEKAVEEMLEEYVW